MTDPVRVRVVADRLSLVWLATVSVAATTYLGAEGVLSSDAVAGLLGSVVALAGGHAIGRRLGEANGHNRRPAAPVAPEGT